MTFQEYLSSLGYGPEITNDVNDAGFYPESGGYYNIQDTGVDPWQIHQQWLAAQQTPEGVAAAQQMRTTPAIAQTLNDMSNQLVAGNAQSFDPQAFQSQLATDSAFNQLSPEDQQAALTQLSQAAQNNLAMQSSINDYNANIGPSGFDWGAVAEMALPVAALFAPELIGALGSGAGAAGGVAEGALAGGLDGALADTAANYAAGMGADSALGGGFGAGAMPAEWVQDAAAFAPEAADPAAAAVVEPSSLATEQAAQEAAQEAAKVAAEHQAQVEAAAQAQAQAQAQAEAAAQAQAQAEAQAQAARTAAEQQAAESARVAAEQQAQAAAQAQAEAQAQAQAAQQAQEAARVAAEQAQQVAQQEAARVASEQAAAQAAQQQGALEQLQAQQAALNSPPAADFPAPTQPVEPPVTYEPVAGPAQAVPAQPITPPETILNPDADIINWQQAQQELANRQLQQSMFGGAARGALVSGLTGGNVLTGAATGGVLGAAGNVIGGITPGLTDSPMVNQAIGGGALGALAAGLRGGDPAVGALSGAATPVFNAAQNAVWNAARGAWESIGNEANTYSPDPVQEQPDLSAYTYTPPELQGPMPDGGALGALSEAQQNMVAGLNQYGIASDAPPPEAGTQPDYGAFGPIFGLPGTQPSGNDTTMTAADTAVTTPYVAPPDFTGTPIDQAPTIEQLLAMPDMPWSVAAAPQSQPAPLPATNQVGTQGTQQNSGAVTYPYVPDAQPVPQQPTTITDSFAPGYETAPPMNVPAASLESTGTNVTAAQPAGANDMSWYTDLIDGAAGAPAAEGVQDASVFQDPYQGLGYSQADIDALLNGTYSGPEQTPQQSQDQLGSLYDLTTGGTTPGAPVSTGTPTMATPGGVNTGPNAGGSGAASSMPAWLQTMLGQNATTSSTLAGLLRGLPGIIGAVGANSQANQLGAIADRQFAVGQPSRSRYEGSFAPGFTMDQDPGFLDSLNQASKANLYGLSTRGNPALNPTAQFQNMTDLYQRNAYPALQNYRNTNSAAGGLASIAAGAPAAQAAAVNAGGTVASNLGGAVGDIFNPKSVNPLMDAWAQLQKAGIVGYKAA